MSWPASSALIAWSSWSHVYLRPGAAVIAPQLVLHHLAAGGAAGDRRQVAEHDRIELLRVEGLAGHAAALLEPLVELLGRLAGARRGDRDAAQPVDDRGGGQRQARARERVRAERLARAPAALLVLHQLLGDARVVLREVEEHPRIGVALSEPLRLWGERGRVAAISDLRPDGTPLVAPGSSKLSVSTLPYVLSSAAMLTFLPRDPFS